MGFFDFLFGGGGNNDAAEAAERAEAERKAKLQADQRRIEGIFSSPQREAQYEDFIAAQRGYLQSDLDREHKENLRQTKFATARSGLSGGSVDVDRGRLLAETYLRGVGEAENRAQGAGAELRGQDQASKQQLFSQLLGGADATTAAQNAGQMMRTNAQRAKTDSTFNAFDKLFGDFGGIYKHSREAAGERRATRDMNLGTLFSPNQNFPTQVSGGIYGG